MSFTPPTPPQPPDPAIADDKTVPQLTAESVEADRGLISLDLSNGAKNDKSFDVGRQDGLQVPGYSDHIRPASPDTLSLLSVEEYEPLRTARSASRDGRRNVSQSPAPPKGWKGRIQASWVRNKGVLMVVLAQVFGTSMNVLTRMLELEGNNGKGMHPFHVRLISFFVLQQLANSTSGTIRTNVHYRCTILAVYVQSQDTPLPFRT